MKSLATHQIRQVLPAPPPLSIASRIRRFAASFWLNYLFWHALHSPRITKATKWFYLWFALRFSRLIKSTTSANARRILGNNVSDERLTAFTRNVVSNFYNFVYDVGRSVRMSRQQLLRQIETTEGADNYQHARAIKKGAIVVTAHMGSFEVGLAALLRHEKNIHVVFKRDAAGLFEPLRQKLRQHLGVIEAPVDDGWTVWLRLREALQRDEVVVVQGDRVMPGQKGQVVPFCNGHVLFPTGPLKLAIATGAPIIPIFSTRTSEGKVRIFIEPAIDVDENAESIGGIHPALRALAAVTEKYVMRYPDQWLVLEHAFCEDIEQRTQPL